MADRYDRETERERAERDRDRERRRPESESREPGYEDDRYRADDWERERERSDPGWNRMEGEGRFTGSRLDREREEPDKLEGDRGYDPRAARRWNERYRVRRYGEMVRGRGGSGPRLYGTGFGGFSSPRGGMGGGTIGSLETYGGSITGGYTGRGPKNYQRSDSRITEDVCERLTEHPDVDASEIEVRVENGEVTLAGTVTDRQARRLAEDLTEEVYGVKQVSNQIRVQEPKPDR